MTTIKIPTPLRRFTDDKSIVEVDASTVEEALIKLVDVHEDIYDHLYDNGLVGGYSLRSFINIYIGQDDIRTLEGLNTEVSESDVLLIVPSIAGG